MRLTSQAFAPGAWIPVRHTCDGTNVSPPLAWADPPAATRSFVLVCSDPDAPGRTWYHWGIYDIPPEARGLSENWSPMRSFPPQAINDFRRRGYGGPCPPRGAPSHHYHFRLYALRVSQLGLGAGALCPDVEAAARMQAIDSCELIGLYGRGQREP
ncbi:YbhB/YbcL family Raf kinase inhibitor-like protein [Rhodopila globiformis]|uniref:Phosphatidylethanolamine-binding protein n=1 Tax=Rhodopila globiformis TaxID=1071 RepID=A0A2S6MYA2_RHOGL|nr:YbhB/YbcL family Raf kinase inhibitor-like protein [Rhodopila globiformis]PPQ27342.1 hypothetical protein CCS01_27740 [Rhodopila globiformis]